MSRTGSTPPPAAPATADNTRPRWLNWLDSLRPERTRVRTSERLRAALGACVGLLITALLCRTFATEVLQQAENIWLIAPFGASAFLIFVVPSSPMAQPWAIIAGNTVSAAIGILCANLMPEPAMAAALAVGVAVLAMFALRCLHPPGGAMALYTSLAHITDPGFVLFPVLSNALLLVTSGVFYNRLTGRTYPQRAAVPTTTTTQTPAARFSQSDLDHALAHYNEYLDISRADLDALLRHAEAAAYQRQFGQLHCSDIMTRNPITTEPKATLQKAWQLLRQHHIKALPVVDRNQDLVGVVSYVDFMRHQFDAEGVPTDSFSARLRHLVSPQTQSPLSQTVDHIMTERVRVVREDQPLVDLVALFSSGGHHHVPVVDTQRRLIGIVTQTDLVRALYKAVRPDTTTADS